MMLLNCREKQIKEEIILEDNVIYVCGLTEYENQMIKEHKGECRYCGHFDCFYDAATGKHNKRCLKLNMRLEEYKADCEDWTLDMR